MTPKLHWEVVEDVADRAGIEKMAPHDLRRTCARLCHLAVVSWIKFNFCSAMFRYKPHLRASAVSRNFGLLLMTSSESNRTKRSDRPKGDRSPLGDFSRSIGLALWAYNRGAT